LNRCAEHTGLNLDWKVLLEALSNLIGVFSWGPSMNISYEWLKAYCKVNLPPEELAERLTFAGLEVEEIIPRDGDSIFVTEVTTNRPDWLSTLGVAREVHAATGAPLDFPEPSPVESSEQIESRFSLEVEEPGLCPRYTARLITDLTVKGSPEWLTRRLEAVGLRPVSNIVDITNYVLWECGQPLHAFDFDKLAGGKVIVRRARASEEITTIDGRRHRLDPSVLVIADASKPVAIAGVMGGLETEVGFSTHNVLIESAHFDPLSIRETSRKLGLVSESSYRFERGVDPEGVEWASRRAAELMLDLAGGRLLAGFSDADFEKRESLEVTLRYDRLNRLLGTEVPREVARQILLRLSFLPKKETRKSITVSVPSYRQDVYREADLVEEVARIYGYDKIPLRCTLPIEIGRRSFPERLLGRLRELLVAMGLYEVMTYSFTALEEQRLFSPWSDAEPLLAKGGSYREGKFLRMSLLPSLLEVKRTNEHRAGVSIRIFELSAVYLPREDEKLPLEQKTLAVLLDGGFFDAKGILSMLLSKLGAKDGVAFEPFKSGFFSAGRSARVFLGAGVIGFIGEIAPAVLKQFDVTGPVAGFELSIDALESLVTLEARYTPLPKFPPSKRDLAIVVDEAVTWDSVEKCLQEAGIDFLESVQFFDEYRGKQLEKGKKSIAFSLTFRLRERTLRKEEVDEAESKILKVLSEKLNARLRGASE